MQGGFTLGAKAGAFQMGSQVQLGGAPATIKASGGASRPRVRLTARLPARLPAGIAFTAAHPLIRLPASLSAAQQAVFGWMYCKVVAGNRFLSWLYRQMAKSMVSTLAKEANKAAAASGAAGAAPVAAAAPA